MQSNPIVILGSGYTGRWIFELLQRQSASVVATSRRPDLNLEYVPPEQRARFDLADSSTWNNLPEGARFIWTFPAIPLEQVQTFAQALCSPTTRLVVLGSTSAYDLGKTPATEPLPWLDESAPINLSLPRVQGEEYLRVHHGAVVLRVAGIYGPGRNPVEWIRRGRVGRTAKFVNLIHVEDLAEICLRALERGTPGQTYNVSDGRPRTWRDICDEAALRWGVTPVDSINRRERGKRISTEKLSRELAYRLRHPDLFQALADLNSP